MSLIVKKFFVSSTPREDGVYVEIVARQSGFFAWLFALFKLDPSFCLKILFDKVTYESSSWHGFTRVIMPIHSVSSIFFGTVRPWRQALFWFSVFAFAAYVAADSGNTGWTLLLVVLGVVVAALVFILNRELCIGVTEVTADNYVLNLKRSVIEGQEISEEKLGEISQIFTALLDAHKAVAKS